MIFVDNHNHLDARINLAIEEHLLRNHHVEDEILFLYINSPSIIVGRNQNTFEEINLPFVETHPVDVVRRLSGGGTVVHDLGNLNFSFISNSGRDNIHTFKKYTEQVLSVLQKMGVPARMDIRNNIMVEGKKVSGNAQYIAGQRMISHGTLLFSSDLSMVQEALRIKPGQIRSKGIPSIRSQVTNISEHIHGPMEMDEFRDRIKVGILAGSHHTQYQLSSKDWDAIHNLVNERYASWKWNYGRSPSFNVFKSEILPQGEVEVRLQVAAGCIQAISFSGDLPDLLDTGSLELHLTGCQYSRNAIYAALERLDLQAYFGDTDIESLTRLIYS